MRPVDASNDTVCSDIIDLDCVVPSSRCQTIRVCLVEFNTEYSVGVTTEISVILHLEGNRFGLLVIESNISVFTCARQKTAIWVVVKRVKLVVISIFNFLLMKAPT